MKSLFCACLFLAALLAPVGASAVETTYEGITVDWDCGLTDLQFVGKDGNNLYYESAQLSPDFELMNITITLPAEYAQSWRSLLSLGTPWEGEIAHVWQNSTAYGDLVLETTFSTSVANSTYNAFGFWVSAYTSDDENAYTSFAIVVSLAESARKFIGNNPDLKGSCADNPNSGCDEACPLAGQSESGSGETSNEKYGLPTYSVNLSTLNLIVEDTDFRSKGLGPSVAATRTWNTDPSQTGMFGKGWNFSYESTLKKSCSGATLLKGSGQGLVYSAKLCSSVGTPTLPITTTPPQGNFDTLTWMEGDYWILEKKENKWKYRYDLKAGDLYRLTSITDRNGNALTLHYDADGNMDWIMDAAGRKTTLAYDSDNRCTGMATPDGRNAAYSYDDKGNLISTVDLLGTDITYTYNDDNTLSSLSYAGKTVSFTYDTSGGWQHVATVTDANGNARTYAGTSNGTTVTDPLGGTTTTYSSRGLLGTTVDPLGNVSSSLYSMGLPVKFTDAGNGVTRWEYDSHGNVTKHTDPMGNVTSYTYDSANNPTNRTNALGETWTYAYDQKSNLTSATSPLGRKTEMTHDSLGQLTTLTDPGGNATTFTYNAFGRMASIKDPEENVTTLGYDSMGFKMTSATDPRGNTSGFEYDANGRLTKVTHADGTFWTYTYDSCALIAVTDENGHTLQMNRDGLLNPVEIIDALGNITSLSYTKNNQVSALMDSLGRTSHSFYDAVGNRTKTTNPLGGEVAMGYDANHNMTSLKDERGKSTLFTFNSNDQLLSVKDPLGRTVAGTRDALGRVAAITNARGGVIAYTFDSDGKLMAKTHDGVNAATYGYDSLGNLTSVLDGTGTQTFTRDKNGRIVAIGYPGDLNVGISYDEAGNVAAVTYPSGLVVSYAHDEQNRLTSMSWDGQSITFAYDAAGNLLQEERSNGTTSSYGYDSNNRLTEIEHKTGATVIAHLAYVRDSVGNIVDEQSTLPVSPTFTALNEVTAFNDANQITTSGSDVYSYDADGNLQTVTGGGPMTAAYSPENQPTEIVRGGMTRAYSYDGLGQRVKSVYTVGNSSHTVYQRYGLDRLLFLADDTGGLVAEYLYAGGKLAAMNTPSGGCSFYHFDKTGNTLAMTDQSGSVAVAYAYDPFGRVVNQTGSVSNPFTYVGAYGVMDERDGLFFMKNRYYDAETGRFLQKDPIGFAGGINLYNYVGNNPVNATDPSGTIPVIPPLVITVAPYALAATAVAVATTVVVVAAEAVVYGARTAIDFYRNWRAVRQDNQRFCGKPVNQQEPRNPPTVPE